MQKICAKKKTRLKINSSKGQSALAKLHSRKSKETREKSDKPTKDRPTWKIVAACKRGGRWQWLVKENSKTFGRAGRVRARRAIVAILSTGSNTKGNSSETERRANQSGRKRDRRTTAGVHLFSQEGENKLDESAVADARTRANSRRRRSLRTDTPLTACPVSVPTGRHSLIRSPGVGPRDRHLRYSFRRCRTLSGHFIESDEHT